ncbi:MAG: hypothetical protein WC201_01685 [Bacilli bacterium]
MKKKIDDLTKAKLMYSGELAIFAILFLVLGLLFILKIIGVANYKKWLFPILTLAGAIWVIIDLVWTLLSPKKKAKSSLIDKWLVLPSALVFLGCDSYVLTALIINPSTTSLDVFFPLYIGITLLYLSGIYVFESIYHFYRPVPALINAVKEDEKALDEDEKKKNSSSFTDKENKK